MLFKVDIDNVCVDSIIPWLARYNHDYEDDLTVDDILEWDMVPFVKPECGYHIYDYLLDDSLYDDAPEVKGAIEGVTALRRRGHKVIFVSAGFNLGKYRWMEQHGFIDAPWQRSASLVVANDKSVIADGILIDDGPHNIININKSILLDRPHNRWYNAQGHRVFDWIGVLKLANVLIHEHGTGAEEA